MVVKHHQPGGPSFDRRRIRHAPDGPSWVLPLVDLVRLVKSLSHLSGPGSASLPSKTLGPAPARARPSRVRPRRRGSYLAAAYYQPQPQPQTHTAGEGSGRRGREMEAVVSAQAELRKPGRRRFGRGVREMTGRRRPLSMQLQLVLMNDVLEDVVRTMREEGGGNSFVDSDGVFEMADGFSRQMAECTAAELAAEDYGFISLNKACAGRCGTVRDVL
ncbi:uncharacterized protein A4U43_C05F20030 [Asparagus officinalis]|uniref:Uncharacterized protein n=1 Tax=Asparagus officinalis TaxID=4686 RepID=A0A5P1ET70_ASPOF|nr:uncharacterized protein A4U43_C05F20030 [Asparagus officinalis]